MATKWGTFSEPGYLHPGIIYNKAYKAPKDVPLSGSFKPALGCTKTGKVIDSRSPAAYAVQSQHQHVRLRVQTNDATFSKFASIHVGDIFEDAQTR